MNEDFKQAFQKMDEAFQHADDGFKRAEKEMKHYTISSDFINSDDYVRIRLSGKRFLTFLNLAKCALQILFTNKATIFVRLKHKPSKVKNPS